MGEGVIYNGEYRSLNSILAGFTGMSIIFWRVN